MGKMELYDTAETGQWSHPPKFPSGALGTSWFNDPQRGLTAILMTNRAQESPEPPPLYLDFWKTAYASLE